KQMFEVDSLGGEVVVWQRTLPDGDWNTATYERSALELMQFSGLHDKNEKEIYEGDILQAENKEGVLGNIKGSVEFIRGAFRLVRKPSHPRAGDTTPVWSCTTAHIVIGNIFESPELLHANNAGV